MGKHGVIQERKEVRHAGIHLGCTESAGQYAHAVMADHLLYIAYAGAL